MNTKELNLVKKVISRCLILYDSIYMTFANKKTNKMTTALMSNRLVVVKDIVVIGVGCR